MEVPNLIGMTYDDAVKNYDKDIVLSFEEEDYNDDYAAGTIYNQSEDAGTRVDRGDNNKDCRNDNDDHCDGCQNRNNQ